MNNKKPSFLPDLSKRNLLNDMHKRSYYLTNLKKAVDNFKAKQTLVDARAANIQRQKMFNYQSEYDRMIFALHHSAVPGLDMAMLNKRRKELKQIGVEAVRLQPTY